MSSKKLSWQFGTSMLLGRILPAGQRITIRWRTDTYLSESTSCVRHPSGGSAIFQSVIYPEIWKEKFENFIGGQFTERWTRSMEVKNESLSVPAMPASVIVTCHPAMWLFKLVLSSLINRQRRYCYIPPYLLSLKCLPCKVTLYTLVG